MVRRLAPLACIPLIVLIVGVSSASASSTVVDTRNDAVTNFISSFGVPNTASYGQTITAPAGSQVITSFTFRVEKLPITDFFRGEIFAWDGTKATGAPLYESLPRTSTGEALQDITFDTGGTPVTPGAQYVLFMSVSKEFEASAGATARFRALTNDTTYPGGKFVFLNNGTNEGEWTTTAWSSIAEDLQFRVRFSSTQQPLTVSKTGNGKGSVLATGGGINCGSDCSESYADGTVVALQATPSPGYVFQGFSGAGCSTSPCLVTMDDAKTVVAKFADVTAPQTTIGAHSDTSISFRSSERGSKFKCKLDKGKLHGCRSPFKLKGLEPGKHSFSVFAIDAAGNKDRSPSKLNFTLP